MCNWWLQVDEPALREGLPLKKDRWDGYLGWAVDAFRYSTWGTVSYALSSLCICWFCIWLAVLRCSTDTLFHLDVNRVWVNLQVGLH